MAKPPPGRRAPLRGRTSWDPLAGWYDGWVGADGSDHHQEVALPTVLRVLGLQPGERVLDIGAGQGVLARAVSAAGAVYTGVDISPKLLTMARRRNPGVRFLAGDATDLSKVSGLKAGGFDAAVFLLSIQDMDPLHSVLASAAWALASGGRLMIFMTHPCFRVPRQSGWGWDGDRRLRYRRIDRYLTPLSVPLKAYPGRQRGVTLSFHRPLQAYVGALAAAGFVVERLEELPTFASYDNSAEQTAAEEIPLFLAIRARKLRPIEDGASE